MKRVGRIFLFLALVSTLLYGCQGGNSQDDGTPKIRLRAGTFDPLRAHPAFAYDLGQPQGAERTRNYYLVQFNGPVTEDDRKLITDQGGEVLDYLPDYSFLVRLPPEGIKQLAPNPAVRWAGDYLPGYRVAPALLNRVGAAVESSTVKLTVQIFAGESSQEVHAQAEADGAAVLIDTQGFSQGLLRLEVDSSLVSTLAADLAKMPEVEWIEEYVQPVLNNDSARWVVQSNQTGVTPLWSHGLTGAGQRVGISDSGIDADMCYFYDASQGLPTGTLNLNQRKVIAYHDWATPDWDKCNHGTHTSTTIAGDNLATPGQPDAYDGVAYNAKLIMQDIGSGCSLTGLPADFNTLFQQAYDDGARIHSNSWGADVGGAYDTYSQQVDQFMWNHKDFLINFSAGNSGSGTNTVGSPASAKNCVSVGASENAHSGYDQENVAYFSSQGPTDDGRIKPTITAPGYFLNSAANDSNISSYNCGTMTMSGTSMACPTTAGLAALVRQYYTDGYYPSGSPVPANGFVPSAALLKATLMNSAANMTGSYTNGTIPATGQGWGRLLAQNTLFFTGGARGLAIVDETGGITTGQSRTYVYSADGANPVKVTLVWTDYPSTPSASVNLVNDLDLTVTAPDSTVYKGNVFASGQSTTGGSADRRNVEEQVLLLTPAAGSYTVRIDGYNIPQGPQPFALVVTGVDLCSPDGSVTLDKSAYSGSATVQIQVSDCDANLNPAVVDHTTVEMTSTTETVPEIVTLNETAISSGLFTGSITLQFGAPLADGNLQVHDGDNITVTYHKANPPGVRTASGSVDASAPIISAVSGHPAASGTSATITWTTNEPSDSTVNYGISTALGQTKTDSTMVTAHSLTLTGLTASKTYYFDVKSADQVGNSATDNNHGSHYTFKTTPPTISVSPSSLSANLYQGQQLTQLLTMKNLGDGADLTFNIGDTEVKSLGEQPSAATVKILSYIQYADIDEEYAHTLSAIAQVSAATGIPYQNYELSDYTQLAANLSGKNVLLIPEQESASSSTMVTVGTAWSTTLKNFVAAGGVVVVCDNTGYSWQILNSGGLMTISSAYSFGMGTVNVKDLSDVVAKDMPASYYANNGSNQYVTSDGNIVVATTTNDPVVIHKTSGSGHVVMIGHDYFASSTDQNKIVGNAVLRLGMPDAKWLSESPLSGSVPAAGLQNINVTYDTHGMAPGSYKANIIINNDDPLHNPVTIPVSLTVNASPDISFKSVVIDDDNIGGSSGDGDGLIEPLEDVGLVVTLANAGSMDAIGVSAHLTCADPNIAILNADQDYGDIPAGGTAATLDEYNIVALPSAPDGLPIPLTLTITDGLHVWVSVFNITVVNKSRIEGHVRRASDNTPVSNATVHYTGSQNGTVTTDITGKYSITGLNTGTFQVWASAPGLLDSSKSSITVPPSIVNLDFSLQNYPAISGQVTRTADGSPVANATVTFTGPVNGTTLTDASGYYTKSMTAAGQYAVKATAIGLSPSAPVQVTVPPSAANVNFALDSLGAISGTVVRQKDGAPVASATITYTGPASGTAISQADGSFNLTGLPAGAYSLVASKSGFGSSSPASVTVPPDRAGIILALQSSGISVSPSAVSVVLPPNITDQRFVQLSNTGGYDLTFTATLSSAPSWAAVLPTSGKILPGKTLPLNLTFNTSGLADGPYATNLIIASNDPDNPSITVPIGLMVASSAAHLSLLSFTVDDDNVGQSSGNGNGFPEPGEDIELPSIISNDGSADVASVSATINTTDPFITIINNSENFGDILSGDASTSIDKYVVSIDADTPWGDTVNLMVQITDSAMDRWEGIITLPIVPVPAIAVTPLSLSANAFESGSTVATTFTIDSLGNGDLVFTITDSQGEGLLVKDSFPSTTIDSTKWVNSGCLINSLGLNPPSTPYALDIRGAWNVTSKVFDTRFWAAVPYEYYWERQGSGTAPLAGDNLVFEWWNGASWVPERTHTSTDGSANSFSHITGVLPPAALLNGFKVRFRNTGISGHNGDYLIDNVLIGSDELSWLTESPATGIIPPTNQQAVRAVFNPTGLSIGAYAGNILIDNNDPLNRRVRIPVSLNILPAPKLALTSLAMDDDALGRSLGNGNGYWEPGEKVEMCVGLANTGHLDSSNTQLTISTTSSKITVIDNMAAIPLVPAGGTGLASNTLSFQVSADAASGDTARILLDEYDPGTGLHFRDSILVQISQVPFMEVSISSLDLTAIQGDMGQATFEITNLGSAILISFIDSSTSWLTTAPALINLMPGDSREITAYLDATSLLPGNYAASLTIYSNDLANQMVLVPVNANVIEGARFETAGTVVDDDATAPSAGDGDGVPEPGEIIELGLKLKNAGALDASGVSAQISTTSTLVQILADTGNYGNITSGSVVLPSENYVVKIDSAAGCGQKVDFNVQITSTTPPLQKNKSFTLDIGCAFGMRGQVREEATGTPIPSAVVTYQLLGGGTSGSVNASGTGDYQITHLAAGTYRLVANKSSCYPASATVDVQIPPDNQIVNLVMKAPIVSIAPSPVQVKILADSTVDTTAGFEMKNSGSLAITIKDFTAQDALTVNSAGGFLWTDNLQASSLKFAWVDLISGGTVITGLGDDTNLGPLPLAFSFPFYGNKFTSFRVCSNGFLSFTSISNSFSPLALPSASAPKNLIAPFWTNLNLNSGGTVAYHSDSSRAVISFIDVKTADGKGPYTFQAILEKDGKVLLQYLKLSSPVNIASAGIQNQDASQGLSLSYLDGYLKENLVVLLSPSTILLRPFDIDQFVLQPGASIELPAKVAPAGMWLKPGSYQASATVTTDNACISGLPVPFNINICSLRFTSIPGSTVLEGNVYYYHAHAQDWAGNPVSYQLAKAPTGMNVNQPTGEVNWHPDWSAIGPNEVRILAESSAGETVDQAFTVTVVMLDADDDLMPDTWEIQYGLDPTKNDAGLDADGDGISNLLEYLYGTDPTVDNATLLDSDHDGMPDVYEIKFGLDPYRNDAAEDPDGDGMTNLVEYYSGTPPMVNNALLPDSDGDGMPDIYEWAHGLDHLKKDAMADAEEDGVMDIMEMYIGTDPQVSNALLPDTDGDGIPDRWELSQGLDPLTNDSALDCDSDGLPNLIEFYDGTPACIDNSKLPDSDKDGMPDSWELANGTDQNKTDQFEDLDGDDMPNYFEYLNGTPAYLANNYLGDADGDGMPDRWELARGTNPFVADDQLDPDSDGFSNLVEYRDASSPFAKNGTYPDADKDLIPDYWEWGWNIHDPNADPDGDGLTNYEEYQRGTNPLRPNTFDYQVTIAPAYIQLLVGETAEFTETGAVAPSSWRVSNPQVCQMIANRTLMAKALGECTMVVQDTNLNQATSLISVVKSKSVQPPTSPVCGNGVCESGETTATCPQDCQAADKGGGGGGGGGGCSCSIASSRNPVMDLVSQQFNWLLASVFWLFARRLRRGKNL